MAADRLWGLPLAQELARDLAGTRVVPVRAIEPDLDPNVHHTNEPYAIISDRHTIAIVEGQKVLLDGPQRSNNVNRYLQSAEDVARNRTQIARIAAAWGVVAPPEHGGLMDTALSIMRFLKQRGAWCLQFEGNSEGMNAVISARGGKYRWPAGLSLRAVAKGIRLTCGDSERDIASLSELADFAAREAPIIDAQLVWCRAHVTVIAKLRPIAQAIVDAINRGVPERTWELSAPDEYFHAGTPTAVTVFTPDTKESTGTLTLDGDAFRLVIDSRAMTFADTAQVVAQCEAIVDAVKHWLTTPAAEEPERDYSYYR